jgi:iron complex outermembrane receptor protein
VVLSTTAFFSEQAFSDATAPSASDASTSSDSRVASTGEITGLEEVTVTARRKTENQQDVPLAVTALSGEFLRENSIVGLHDLSGRVPALNIDNYNSPV